MDKREDILVRLLAVCRTVVGVAKVVRNEQVTDDWDFPALILLDADEEADDAAFGRNRPPQAPKLVTMTPELYVILGEVPEAVGTELNRLRVRILKAVLTDAELAAIVGTNGEIRYESCATGLVRGRQIIGEMGLVFAFVYLLEPTKL